MNRNYLTEKINTYRKGVLMGDYVEQLYKNDQEQRVLK